MQGRDAEIYKEYDHQDVAKGVVERSGFFDRAGGETKVCAARSGDAIKGLSNLLRPPSDDADGPSSAGCNATLPAPPLWQCTLEDTQIRGRCRRTGRACTSRSILL